MDKPSHLPNYISRLEQELTKIESFKRELPLSFLLLTDAFGRLKKEGEEVDVDRDKKAWMSSAQLWSSDNPSSFRKLRECKFAESIGLLSSFNEGSGKLDVESDELVLTGPVLSLQVRPEPVSGSMRETGVEGGARFTSVPPVLSPGPKKERRCWSPELHRRFVNALDKLGGSQVATPKQIRELMQVNDLTNDEVKSHLQKYRLHIRKLPRSTRQGAMKMETSYSGSPQGPLQLGMASAKCSSSPTKLDGLEDIYEEKSDSHGWE